MASKETVGEYDKGTPAQNNIFPRDTKGIGDIETRQNAAVQLPPPIVDAGQKSW